MDSLALPLLLAKPMKQLAALNFCCSVIRTENHNFTMMSTVTGFVFAGGQSTRFGSNKLFHPINDIPMGLVVLNNLSGCLGDSSLVGPAVDHPDFVNVSRVSGDREGHGPLGAMCDVLESATTDFVVFAPCDTPFFTSSDFQSLIQGQADHDVVVAADFQPPHLRHWLLSCWSVKATRDHMSAAYSSGERAIHRAVTGLNVFEQHFPHHALTNINTPSDTQ
jgi:molybdopterin-guanine dinucleotide biosynthesis protein A